VSPQEAAAANAQADVDCTAGTLTSNNCKIYGWLVIFIRALSAMVGIVVVIMVAVGGVQYTMSKDNPQATSEAKNRIKNAIIALVIYIFMFAFLQWLVPGGVV
jgi:cytochrome bd-type quinol oxidase subunit 2